MGRSLRSLVPNHLEVLRNRKSDLISTPITCASRTMTRQRFHRQLDMYDNATILPRSRSTRSILLRNHSEMTGYKCG
jgi:hypothetical protein